MSSIPLVKYEFSRFELIFGFHPIVVVLILEFRILNVE